MRDWYLFDNEIRVTQGTTLGAGWYDRCGGRQRYAMTAIRTLAT
jgi:hypothetical protein